MTDKLYTQDEVDALVREARISELHRLIGTGGLTPELQVKYWNARIAELKEQK